MRIYLMTDLEGVAGVQSFQGWTGPGMPYYPLARRLLTQEVNAAVAGFFAGGATQVRVVDGHGPGAVDIEDLDPRVEYQRGWAQSWPMGLEEGIFDAVAWVGQHARSRTPHSNMAHTQSCEYLELSVNGVAIGEFGQLALCASQWKVRAIFAAGEQAFCREAQELVPGIETVAVKRGLRPGRGDECTAKEYEERNSSAVHLHPQRARQLIREGAERSVRRAREESFGIIPLRPPFRRVTVLRATEEKPRRYDIAEHPDDICALMAAPFDFKPIEDEAQLRGLLVD